MSMKSMFSMWTTSIQGNLQSMLKIGNYSTYLLDTPIKSNYRAWDLENMVANTTAKTFREVIQDNTITKIFTEGIQNSTWHMGISPSLLEEHILRLNTHDFKSEESLLKWSPNNVQISLYEWGQLDQKFLWLKQQIILCFSAGIMAPPFKYCDFLWPIFQHSSC